MKITIKYHEPNFSQNDVLDYFKFQKYPANLRKKIVTWTDIKDSLTGGKYRPKRIKSFSSLLWVISPEFYLTKHGLFLTDMGRYFKLEERDIAGGRFQIEGLVNHVHLEHIITNRIAQYEVGVRAIRAWIPALQTIKDIRKSVIYLNGPKDFTLCVYSEPQAADIKNLDGILPNGSELMECSADKFIEWSLS